MNEKQKPTNDSYRDGWNAIWGRAKALDELVEIAEEVGAYTLAASAGVASNSIFGYKKPKGS